MTTIQDIEDRLSVNNTDGITGPDASALEQQADPEASALEQQASAPTPPVTAQANNGVSAEKALVARVLDFNNIDETSQRFANTLANSRQQGFGRDR